MCESNAESRTRRLLKWLNKPIVARIVGLISILIIVIDWLRRHHFS